MRYGDEQELLKKTTSMIEDLYLWIRGTSFDLEANRKLQRKRAEALWQHCFFDIAPRS